MRELQPLPLGTSDFSALRSSDRYTLTKRRWFMKLPQIVRSFFYPVQGVLENPF